MRFTYNSFWKYISNLLASSSFFPWPWDVDCLAFVAALDVLFFVWMLMPLLGFARLSNASIVSVKEKNVIFRHLELSEQPETYISLIVSSTAISLLNICAMMCWMPSLILSTLSRPSTDLFTNSVRFGRLASPESIFNVTSSSPNAFARSASVALLSVLYGAYWYDVWSIRRARTKRKKTKSFNLNFTFLFRENPTLPSEADRI